ncbi:MAG: transporter permease [Devosia sp.]|nr:transporter permease [Devosia sp.]
MLNSYRAAFKDITAALKLRRVWMAFASEDIGDQYRRTTLGPLWLVINYLAMIAIFIFLFDRGNGLPHFATYAATGLLVWSFLSELLMQSVTLFVREEAFIKGTTLPLSVYAMRMVMQSLIRMGYTVVGCLVVISFDGIAPLWSWLWVLPGLAILIFAVPPMVICFGFLGAYFPDSQYLVNNAMRIGMFVTPVFWVNPGNKALRSALYHYNPFTYALELFRLPVLEGRVPLLAFAVCGGGAILLWLVALPLLGRLRRQVVFVL